MPEYTRICNNGHMLNTTERMLCDTAVICWCGILMHRKPHVLAVNWGGLPPSAGELSPTFKRLIEDAPRRRDEEVSDKNRTIVRLEDGD